MKQQNKGKEQNVENNSTYSELEKRWASVIVGFTTESEWGHYLCYKDNLLEYLELEEDLPYELILEKCCSVWQIDKHQILKKLDRTNNLELIQIYSFFWACQLFNNGKKQDLWKFFGRKAYSSEDAHCKINPIVKHNIDGYGSFIINIFIECVKACPKRIENAFAKLVLDEDGDGETKVYCHTHNTKLRRQDVPELKYGETYVVAKMHVDSVLGFCYQLNCQDENNLYGHDLFSIQ